MALQQGPCTTRVQVEVQTLLFLNCPTVINVYVPFNETTAAVSWDELRLPDSLGQVEVSRNLGDTESTSSPYVYGVGTRRVRYETAPFSAVNIGIVCEFDVNVLTGFSVPVGSIGRVATPTAVQEFILVEAASSGSGARLPTFNGPLTGETLNVGVASPPGKPFSITPGVSLRAWQGA